METLTVLPHEQLDLTRETGWPDGVQPPLTTEPVAKTDLAGEKVPLTTEERLTQFQREQWSADHPGSPAFYREQFTFDAAGNKVVTQEATIQPEDMDRLETVARDYKLDTLLEGQRQTTLEAWASVEEVVGQRKEHLLQRSGQLGATEGTNLDIIEKAAVRARDEALQKHLEETFPMPPEPEGGFRDKLAYRRARKHVDAQRQALRHILEIRDPGKIESLKKDWEAHDSIMHAEEMDQLHGKALKEDKTYKSGKERSEARKEIVSLDEKYGGALEQIASLPMYRELGANSADGRLNAEARTRVAEVIKAYQGHLGEIEDDDEREIIIRQAANDLRWQLGISLDKLGTSQDQIAKTTEDAQKALELWVRNMEPSDNPIADLENYQNQRRKEQLWDRRRQGAANYAGKALMKRMFSKFERLPSLGPRPEVKSELDNDLQQIREALGLVVDPTGSRAEAGADFLADPSKADNYRERVMSQLSLMRHHSRHESTLVKSALFLSAAGREGIYGARRGGGPLARKVGEQLVKTWDSLSDKDKNSLRKRQMLKVAATSWGLSARLAKRAAAAGKDRVRTAPGGP